MEMFMKRKNYRSPLLLFLGSMIWGTAFVAQSQSIGKIGPNYFNACRFFLGIIVLLPLIFFLSYKRRSLLSENSDVPAASREMRALEKKNLIKGGTICGIFVFFASGLQQIGLQYTTAGKSGFLTALYILLVPIFGLLLGQRISKIMAVALPLAILGMYLLCIKEGFSINKGDVITVFSAVCYALQILAVDRYAPRVDSIKLACFQFFIAGLLSLITAFFIEDVGLQPILAAWPQIFYLGVFSSSIAYTFQIIGQKGVSPAVASLIMSLESVISVLSGWIFLGDVLSAKEILGCVLMFTAILLAQIPLPLKKQCSR